MYCILNPNIGLRSWVRTPYAYYVRHERNAKRLTREEYELLKQCDAKTDLAETPLLLGLIRAHLALPSERGAHTLTDWQDKTYENRYFPAMNLMITGKCNYNCLHCFNAADNAPLQSEWTLEEVNRLLDEARDCGINGFTITGGEPMLHKNFFEILEGIYAREMYVFELNTNGHFLTEEALCRMERIGCRPLMKISFDGIGWHDWLRNRKGAEEDALRAMRLCIEHRFPVKAQMNVHRKNLSCIAESVRLLDELGAAETRVIRTTEAPRWEQNANGATLSFGEYMDAMVALFHDYALENRNMDLTAWQIGTLIPGMHAYTVAAVEYCPGEFRESFPVCRGNRGMIAVGANGTLYPCHQLSGYYEAHHDFLGNVKKTPLRELLADGPYLNEICTSVGTLREHNEKCAACRYFEACAGGCRAIAMALTNDKLGCDPSKCYFFEHGYYEKLIEALPGWKNLSPIGGNRPEAGN